MTNRQANFEGAHEFQAGDHVARFVMKPIEASPGRHVFWDGDLRSGYLGHPLSTSIGTMISGGACDMEAAFDGFVSGASKFGVQIPLEERLACLDALQVMR